MRTFWFVIGLTFFVIGACAVTSENEQGPVLTGSDEILLPFEEEQPTGKGGSGGINPSQIRGLQPSAIAARKVLEDNSCFVCHTAGGEADFFYVDDRDDMLAKNIIDLAIDPKDTRLIRSLNRAVGFMPKGSNRRVPQAEQDKLIAWLSDGAPPLKDESVNPGGDPSKYEDELRAIVTDLLSIRESERETTRYLLISPVHNTGDADQAERLSLAIHKTLNSVTFNVRLEEAFLVRGTDTVYRINLDDYDINADEYDDILINGVNGNEAQTVGYPYAIKFNDEDAIDLLELQIAQLTDNGSKVLYPGTNFTNQTISVIRADWWAEQISKPPFYHDLLYGKGRINNDIELEDFLGLDLEEQFEDEVARRGIMRRSGVSFFNRAVDYFELDYGGAISDEGFYWKSYDFKGEQNAQNVLANPFGPPGLLAGISNTRKIFQHNASEMIFSLPNGLSGYFLCIVDLATGVCERVDEGDPQVVFDRSNLGQHLGLQGGSIVNGVSCMGCHAGGMNSFNEEGRRAVQGNPAFNNNELNLIRDITPTDQRELDQALAKYSRQFGDAQQVIGISQVKHTNQAGEPTYSTARYYRDYVEACQLGAELYLDCNTVKTTLQHAVALSTQLGFAADGGGQATRDVIEDEFDDILLEFDIGRQVLFTKSGGIKPPPTGEKCELSFLNRSEDKVGFRLVVGSATTREIILRRGQVQKFTNTQKLPVSLELTKWSFSAAGKKYKLESCENYSFKHESHAPGHKVIKLFAD